MRSPCIGFLGTLRLKILRHAMLAPLHRRLASAASQLLACRSRAYSAKLAGLRSVFGQLAPARITHLESSVSQD